MADVYSSSCKPGEENVTRYHNLFSFIWDSLKAKAYGIQPFVHNAVICKEAVLGMSQNRNIKHTGILQGPPHCD